MPECISRYTPAFFVSLHPKWRYFRKAEGVHPTLFLNSLVK